MIRKPAIDKNLQDAKLFWLNVIPLSELPDDMQYMISDFRNSKITKITALKKMSGEWEEWVSEWIKANKEIENILNNNIDIV
jgi:hypothetical protein